MKKNKRILSSIKHLWVFISEVFSTEGKDEV